MTLRYLRSTAGELTSCWNDNVCFIQLESSRCRETKVNRFAKKYGNKTVRLDNLHGREHRETLCELLLM